MKWEEIVKNHDIRKMYQNAHLDKITHLPKSMMDLAHKWINSEHKPSLFLTGPVGSGKTYFMTAILRSLVERGYYWFRFTRSVDLFDELLKSIVDKKSNEYMLRTISEAPFLFIDDVGVENMTDRVKKEYFSIIDYRTSEMLPFVLTSNLTKEQFGKELGERVESRMHMCVEIEFPEKDLRKQINFYEK
jgi:DNA replication protein DnaC